MYTCRHPALLSLHFHSMTSGHQPEVTAAREASAISAPDPAAATKRVDSVARPSARLNHLSSHFLKRHDLAPETPEVSISEYKLIERLLTEKVLLFQYGDDPAKAGLDVTTYGDNFEPIPDGLTNTWRAWKQSVLFITCGIYAQLSCNKVVFLTPWHPNMYGGDITHVSVIMVGKTADGPQVLMSHHESIPVPADRSYQDGRMPKSLGVRMDTYDTRAAFEKCGVKASRVPDLPVIKSITLGGLPNVGFSIGHDFQAVVDYHKRCMETSRHHFSELIYAPFSSTEKRAPRHYYATPNETPVPPEKLQINTCYSAAIDYAIAAKVDGYETLERADLPQQGRQLLAIRLLSNTSVALDGTPGVATFKRYATEAGVNPSPEGDAPQREFVIQGQFLGKLKQYHLDLQDYRRSMLFLKMLPGLFARPKPAPPKLSSPSL